MMKIKAFALILCIILCFSVLMVGCQKECTGHVDEDKNAKCDICKAEVCLTHTDADNNAICEVCGMRTVPECELHTDADKDRVCDVCKVTLPEPCAHEDVDANGYCDKCNGAIVVIDQPALPEEGERVDMIVNEIPKDVPLSNYINAYDPKTYTSCVEVDSLLNNRYGYDSNYVESSDKVKYTVKNLISGDTVLEVTLDLDSSLNDEGGVLCVREGELYTYYSYAGDKLIEQTGSYSYYEELNGWNYVTIDEKIYVVDAETYKVVAKELDPKTLVKYPYFDTKNDKFGYGNYDNTIYIYDLTKVSECAYSYDIPSYYEEARWFVLENGNVLVQAVVELKDDAISYDFFEDGEKYDIVYDMIDPAAKAVNSVEFGYYIENLEQPAEDSAYSEKALNIANVYCITNDRVDRNAKTMVIDNELKVLFDVTSVFGSNIQNITAVAKDRYLVERVMGTDEYGWPAVVKEVLNGKGEHITYLSENVELTAGAVVYNGKLFDLNMKLVEAVKEFDFIDAGSGYAIFHKDGEYFIYNGGKEPKLIGNIWPEIYEFGYVLDNGAERVLYGANGEELFKTDGYYSYDYEIADGVFLVGFSGNTYVIS